MNTPRDSERDSRLDILGRLLRWAHLDPPMLTGILAILTFATVVLFSASGQSWGMMQAHAVKVAVAMAAMLVAARVDPAWLRRGAPWLYLAGLGLGCPGR
jgi:rod shape determining protein RodA